MQLHKRVVEDGCDDKAARIQSVGLLHRVPKRAQVVTTTHSDSVAIVHVALLDVVWQEEEFFDLLLLLAKLLRDFSQESWVRRLFFFGHNVLLTAVHDIVEFLAFALLDGVVWLFCVVVELKVAFEPLAELQVTFCLHQLVHL